MKDIDVPVEGLTVKWALEPLYSLDLHECQRFGYPEQQKLFSAVNETLERLAVVRGKIQLIV